MLSAYFNIPPPNETGDKKFGRKPPAKHAAKRTTTKPPPPPPQPTEPSTTSEHVKFEPLPPEKRVPRPAEEPGQAWHSFDGVTAAKDDDIAEFRADWEWEDEEQKSEDEELSEPDFEPESLDPVSLATSVEDSMTSMDDDSFFQRRRAKPPSSQRTVYSGPQLCYEDDDFE